MQVLGVTDRTNLIMEVNKVITKRNLMNKSQARVNSLMGEITFFKSLFKDEVYTKLLIDKKDNDAKFVNMEVPLKGTIRVELLPKEFGLYISMRLTF